MKKFLLSISIVIIIASSAYAQSVRFSDLILFTNLSNREVYDNLMQGNVFKQDYSANVKGQELEYYRRKNLKPDAERIEVGKFVKLYDGTILRTVNYTSTDVQNVINMVSQAKRFGLDLKFRGADQYNNIYLYDNSFYSVSIYLRRDQSSGLVEIKQKEYLGLE